MKAGSALAFAERMGSMARQLITEADESKNRSPEVPDDKAPSPVKGGSTMAKLLRKGVGRCLLFLAVIGPIVFMGKNAESVSAFDTAALDAAPVVANVVGVTAIILGTDPEGPETPVLFAGTIAIHKWPAQGFTHTTVDGRHQITAQIPRARPYVSRR